MKAFTITLAASMLFLAAPFATATIEEECPAPDPTSYVEHPLQKGRYLWIDAREPNKLGEWTEGNRVSGLQTSACFYLGIHRFGADKQADILP